MVNGFLPLIGLGLFSPVVFIRFKNFSFLVSAALFALGTRWWEFVIADPLELIKDCLSSLTRA